MATILKFHFDNKDYLGKHSRNYGSSSSLIIILYFELSTVPFIYF